MTDAWSLYCAAYRRLFPGADAVSEFTSPAVLQEMVDSLTRSEKAYTAGRDDQMHPSEGYAAPQEKTGSDRADDGQGIGSPLFTADSRGEAPAGAAPLSTDKAHAATLREMMRAASTEMLARWILKNLDWSGGNSDENGEFLAAILEEHARQSRVQSAERMTDAAIQEMQADVGETMQILGKALTGDDGVHIGHLPDMARELVAKLTPSAKQLTPEQLRKIDEAGKEAAEEARAHGYGDAGGA